MKKLNFNFILNHFLLLTLINEVCGGSEKVVQNTGGKKQCLEGPVQTYALAKESFAFDDFTDIKLEESWDTAKENKDVVMFYDVEELEPNNTEAIVKNARYKDYHVKDAIKGVNYTHYLSSCSHEALKSYEDSAYTRIFRISEDNEISCEVQDDGTIKGEPLTSFLVGIRNDAPADGVPSTQVQLKFGKYSQSIVIPSFTITNYEGIYDVKLNQVSASSTEIKFTLKSGCTGDLISSFVDGNIELRDGGGALHTNAFIAADSEGVYTLTGTGFQTGFTVGVVGVVKNVGIHYEGESTLSITVS